MKGEAAIVQQSKWQVLGAVGVGTFVMALNASMMNITVPFIGSYFHAPMSVVEWVLMAFLLAISTLLLTFGRLGDVYGFRKTYLLISLQKPLLKLANLSEKPPNFAGK